VAETSGNSLPLQPHGACEKEARSCGQLCDDRQSPCYRHLFIVAMSERHWVVRWSSSTSLTCISAPASAHETASHYIPSSFSTQHSGSLLDTQQREHITRLKRLCRQIRWLVTRLRTKVWTQTIGDTVDVQDRSGCQRSSIRRK